ncbi:MAG: sigma-70 family RNA polymerase sigma factor [Planctomycetes bacterium]|nr:sigma-70 family RNA polymerase sigma factor [Planctomycetota bacterium]
MKVLQQDWAVLNDDAHIYRLVFLCATQWLVGEWRKCRRLEAFGAFEPADRPDTDTVGHPDRVAALTGLMERLDTLPAEEKLWVRLNFFESMKLTEIARYFALPYQRFYARFRRALSTLAIP